MNDDVKKALELAPLGYKADHAQLWMHLQILAEYVKGEPARTKTTTEEVRAEIAASYITANNYLHARVAELESEHEGYVSRASETCRLALERAKLAEERVAELEHCQRCPRKDVKYHLCGDCGDEPGVVANLHVNVMRAEARVAELETVLRDTCREKVLHGHTTTLLTDALRLKVPGVENYEDWVEERESKLQKAEARIKELESVLDGYGARDLQEMSEKLKAAEVRTKNLEAAYAAISPQTIEKWRNGELTAGELISFGHETGLLTRAKVLEVQIAAARKLAEEFSKDTFDSSGETAAAGFQMLAAMDEAAKGIT